MKRTLAWHDKVQTDISASPELRAEMVRGAIESMIEGDLEVGLIMLHDVVKAEMGFPELARRTGIHEKSLRRALSRRGNPTIRTIGRVARALQEA